MSNASIVFANEQLELAMARDTVTVTIRVSKELHRWLLAEAKANHRSLNKEIEHKLMTLKAAKENETRKK